MTGTTRTKRLSELAAAAGDLLEDAAPDASIEGLAYDSRGVRPGDLFFCVPGATSDGHDFAADAVGSGAVAVVVERPVEAGVPEIVVSDARRAMGRIAAQFFGHPAKSLLLLGVTGTNGKTTTAYLLEAILRAAGHNTGLIGTIETKIRDVSEPGVRTTPESVDLQALFARMRAAGTDAVAMEVTSHALTLERVEGVLFDAVGFTNLSQDHLDFHRDMEDYFAAKSGLFSAERSKRGAANADDPYGRRLLQDASVPCLSFGTQVDADVRAGDVRVGTWGNELVVTHPTGDMKLSTALVGAFNVSNCLAACAISLQAGIDVDAIQRGIESVGSVPGRFEPVDAGQPFTVVVDYAHTPDSLDNVLREARRLAASQGGRVVCVFGCGGDRDRGKRPLMGATAARLADVVVVTSDNPRSEDPHAIIDQIVEGVVVERPEGPELAVVDRREAIARAVALARDSDVVVIAGKGHETGQEFADTTIAFDDREVARAALEQLS